MEENFLEKSHMYLQGSYIQPTTTESIVQEKKLQQVLPAKEEPVNMSNTENKLLHY